ncbi:protein SIEVE ELEMENT OCCLUSION B-like [Cynara cardunculus var. scolymus]|uniref:protein SIEVE ELEMENT OCCLUSION B-like n=1 Tax=Cynara cardunculus var. scolymus TaxID=59895 RepID=UPI000D62E6DF|nr:protein SIEVE ELEMENT OCCLUSION B-like [Cynara cardunculus var. scolymus]
MDSSTSNFMKGIPALTSGKKYSTPTNPLTGTNSTPNPKHQQEQQQQQQQQQQEQLIGPMNKLMGPMNNMGSQPPMNNQLVQQMVSQTRKPMQQSTSEGNSIFSATDDNVIMKQVISTHLPDGTDVDVKPLLNIVEDILKHATINADPISSSAHTDGDKLDDKPHHTNAVVMLNSLSHIIDKLANEMALKCLTGGDGHTTALALFHTVGNFHWDAKLVLTLAAFALNYGEFWLLAQIYSSNHLAKSMAILRQVPSIMEHTAPLKPRFNALNKLIHSILELTQCILQFKELPSMYITPDMPALASAINIIPTAVYWNIRGIITCASQIANLTSMGHEYGISSTELQSWELSSITLKINHIHEFLRQQLENCRQVVGDKKEIEFRRSFNQLFETNHIDNMKILRILINPRDNMQPLFDGSTKKRVSLEVLRRRNVLLLISGLDMSNEELSILEDIYGESRIQGTRMDALYEIVWMPIIDPSVQYTDAMDRKFEEMMNRMPWYSVSHPSLIERPVIRSIGDRWHFRNKPILVVFDPQGRELSPNAIHMMWIWGSNAFPFTSIKEEQLWKDETWRLELLVSGMDQTILNWIRDDKYIFLFGGDDIEWIRKFTTTARAMATAARIPLEMVYVGKSKKKESVRRAISTITLEKLSYCWQETTLMWFFWRRLGSMLYSKIQLKKADDQDPMMQQIKKLLSYDKEGSWALLSKGSKFLTNGHGSTMMQTPADFDVWKEHIPSKGFDLSFTDYHDKLHVEANNCCRFEFPIAAGRIPNSMRCPECHQLMEKYIAFLCCHDHTGLLEPY